MQRADVLCRCAAAGVESNWWVEHSYSFFSHAWIVQHERAVDAGQLNCRSTGQGVPAARQVRAGILWQQQLLQQLLCVDQGCHCTALCDCCPTLPAMTSLSQRSLFDLTFEHIEAEVEQKRSTRQ
jgi:hypothetical protein